MRQPSHYLAGGFLAVVAAVSFGVTTPWIKSASAAAGPFTTAGLLYAGAALASVVGRSSAEAPVRRAHVPRLLAVALLGAVVAPVCLAWGLARTSATSAALLLNFEAVFTVFLARLCYAEPIGGRAGWALGSMFAGGAVLVLGQREVATQAVGWGMLAVLGASLGWAADNALTRPLADLDPPRVVAYKGGLGASLSLTAAALSSEKRPAWEAVAALVACGAIGYGASLRFYLMAQRRVGAARTASVFAVAPFVGVVVAWVAGERGHETTTLAASAFFVLAVYLHLTESHEHRHAHARLEHEHAHRHDDDHHDHSHHPPVPGVHTHWHTHEPTTHAHPHGPDAHHRHEH